MLSFVNPTNTTTTVLFSLAAAHVAAVNAYHGGYLHALPYLPASWEELMATPPASWEELFEALPEIAGQFAFLADEAVDFRHARDLEVAS